MADLLLTADFEIDGWCTRLEVFGESMKDLREPLARCGGYIRGQAKRRCDEGGPGWEPLATSTVKRKPTVAKIELHEALFPRRRPGKVRVMDNANRIVKYQGKAALAKTTKMKERWLAKVQAEGEAIEFYQRAFGAAAGIKDTAALLAYARKEKMRQQKHGAALAAARDIALQPGERVETYTYKNKQGQERHGKRIANISKLRRNVREIGSTRYNVDIRATQLLGSLRDSIHLLLELTAVVVFSGPAWSGVHNKPPGTKTRVGHGAEVPGRRFLVIDQMTVRIAAGIFKEYMLQPFIDHEAM